MESVAVHYCRELDLNSAVARTTFTRRGGRHTPNAFVSHPTQALVWHWSADKAGALSELARMQDTYGETTMVQNNAIVFRGTLANGLQHEARALVVARGVTAEVQGGGLQLNNCDEATPAARIVDWPAFQIRGSTHDTGRNFQSIESLQTQLDHFAADNRCRVA